MPTYYRYERGGHTGRVESINFSDEEMRAAEAQSAQYSKEADRQKQIEEKKFAFVQEWYQRGYDSILPALGWPTNPYMSYELVDRRELGVKLKYSGYLVPTGMVKEFKSYLQRAKTTPDLTEFVPFIVGRMDRDKTERDDISQDASNAMFIEAVENLCRAKES